MYKNNYNINNVENFRSTRPLWLPTYDPWHQALCTKTIGGLQHQQQQQCQHQQRHQQQQHQHHHRHQMCGWNANIIGDKRRENLPLISSTKALFSLENKWSAKVKVGHHWSEESFASLLLLLLRACSDLQTLISISCWPKWPNTRLLKDYWPVGWSRSRCCRWPASTFYMIMIRLNFPSVSRTLQSNKMSNPILWVQPETVHTNMDFNSY